MSVNHVLGYIQEHATRSGPELIKDGLLSFTSKIRLKQKQSWLIKDKPSDTFWSRDIWNEY